MPNESKATGRIKLSQELPPLQILNLAYEFVDQNKPRTTVPKSFFINEVPYQILQF